MRAGALDRVITVRRRMQTGTSPLNQPIFEWVPVLSTWAQRVDMGGNERFAAGQPYAVSTATFKTRWFPDLEPTDIIACEGVTYDVKGIKELGRREGLEITCEAQS